MGVFWYPFLSILHCTPACFRHSRHSHYTFRCLNSLWSFRCLFPLTLHSIYSPITSLLISSLGFLVNFPLASHILPSATQPVLVIPFSSLLSLSSASMHHSSSPCSPPLCNCPFCNLFTFFFFAQFRLSSLYPIANHYGIVATYSYSPTHCLLYYRLILGLSIYSAV